MLWKRGREGGGYVYRDLAADATSAYLSYTLIRPLAPARPLARSTAQLLDRVFAIMRAKNPDMVAGEKRRFVMKPPQVTRVGTRKSAFVNFTDICKMCASFLYCLVRLVSIASGDGGLCRCSCRQCQLGAAQREPGF